VNVIGDLERLFATSVYPLRVPIAIGVALAMAGLLVLARRRGWFAAARRHPGRTGTLAVVVLAIGLPVGWYLASPLFIRTELIEPPPIGATAIASMTPVMAPTPGPSVATSGPSMTSSEPTPTPTPSPTPFVATSLAAGPFHGADDFHFGEGMASIIEIAPGKYTLRFEEFSVRNGPDLYVYLSPDAAGYAEGALELGTLKATDGAFGYDLPAGADPADFASAVIWCKQFAVLFAVAPLAAV
jgi:hypothetical protein